MLSGGELSQLTVYRRENEAKSLQEQGLVCRCGSTSDIEAEQVIVVTKSAV
jgi:hypothetical protein